MNAVDPANPNIAARLGALAADYPDRIALIEYRNRWRRQVTFGDLSRRVRALSAGLVERGIRQGDSVVLFVPMSIELYVALLAVIHAGAIAVFVDAWADAGRLDAAIALASPKAFIGVPAAVLLRLRSRHLSRVPIRLVCGRRFFPLSRYERRPGADAALVDADSPAIVTFTTGSTGAPRGAPRTHANLWAQHLALADHLHPRASDVDLPALPMFALNNMACGVTTVIPDVDPRRPARFDPGRVFDQVARERVTTASGSPAFFERLLDRCDDRDLVLPFRAVFTGGAPVWPSLARRLAGPRIAGTAHVVYGSTEVEPIAGIPVPELVRTLDEPSSGPGGLCIGQPVATVSLRLVRPTSGVIEPGALGLAPWQVPDGEVGEIVVSGAHVLPAYLNDDHANALSHFRAEGAAWFRTGDCAWRARDGRLWLVGRLSQRVVRASGVVWPLPVELDAARLPFVRHAALVGVGNDESNQRALLCVEVSAGLSGERDRQLRSAVSRWGVDVRELRDIPRDPRHHSKTNMSALKEMLRGV